jgi:hypothetical protein
MCILMYIFVMHTLPYQGLYKCRPLYSLETALGKLSLQNFTHQRWNVERQFLYKLHTEAVAYQGGGVGGSPPKFRSFDKAELNS